MGRTIVRGQGIDHRPDLLAREGIGLRGGILEVVGQVGIQVGILEATGRRGMWEGIVLEVHREEGMPGIVLEIREELRLAIREGIGLVVGMPEPGLVGQHLEIPAGIGLEEIQVGMREGVDLRRITHGLRIGIPMRDFRREGEEAIGHKDSGLRNRLSSGLNSLNNGLSRDHRLPAHDRVGSAGITMPEQLGRRAIAVEPVLVAAVETGEVETNETSQS
jgi:hypothetical protein